MSETVQISLSRALKLKNRLTHQLSQLDGQITAYNDAIEGHYEYDVRALYEDRKTVVEQLIKLKVAINAANQPIQGLIYQLAESKSLIAMLNRVSTKHGPTLEGHPYSSTKYDYQAQFRKADINREVHRIEQEIDRIQDELDRFNHSKLISVDGVLLADPEPSSSSL